MTQNPPLWLRAGDKVLRKADRRKRLVVGQVRGTSLTSDLVEVHWSAHGRHIGTTTYIKQAALLRATGQRIAEWREEIVAAARDAS